MIPVPDRDDPSCGKNGPIYGLEASIRRLIEGFTGEGGRSVDYAGLAGSADLGEFRSRLKGLGGLGPRDIPAGARGRVFWINLYNAAVLDSAAASVAGQHMAVDDFFKPFSIGAAGHRLSLEDVEHGILRSNGRRYMRPFRHFRRWDSRLGLSLEPPADPRVCFCLFRGTRSGPPLRFYEPEGIEAQLHRASVDFINSGGAVLDLSAGTLALSRLFRWYARDFGGNQGVMRFITAHILSPEAAAFITTRAGSLRVTFQPYDRSLNGDAAGRVADS